MSGLSMHGKLGVWGGVSVLLALVTSCATSLSQFKEKPQVDLQSFQIQDPTLTGATLLLNLGVTNPNPVGITLKQVNYIFNMNGKDLAQGKLDKDLRLDANGTSVVQIPVRFQYTEVFDSFSALWKSKSTPFQIRGSMAAGPFKIPYEYSGKIDLPK